MSKLEKNLKVTKSWGYATLEDPEVYDGVDRYHSTDNTEVLLSDGNYYPIISETGRSITSGHGTSSPAYSFLYAQTDLGLIKLEMDGIYIFRPV